MIIVKYIEAATSGKSIGPLFKGQKMGPIRPETSVKNYHYTLCKTQKSADSFVKFIFRKMILMHDQSQNILVSNLFGCMIAWIDPSCRAVWVCSLSLAENVGYNPAGVIDVRPLWVFSGSGLCVGLITRLEETYRVWCV